MRHLVLGTAGHIDHGKTTLVRALTGTDTDRLPEEKRRGITIDLGFARLPLDDALELGIVDVPGHEAFVRNMLAGATGIDMVMLVVAADEGVMPQTREHLAIMTLLGVSRGLVAVTKADAAEAEWIELVQEEVRELLSSSLISGAAVLPVSARTGAGLAALRTELARLAAGVPRRPQEDLFRMPIDRVFTVRGTGTVATGTVWSGSLQRDQQVRIEPAGLTARVRGLQQHGADCAEVGPGSRAAVALTGVDRHVLRRGDTLLRGDGWVPASMLTVDLHVLPDAAGPVRPRQRVRVHIGTAEALARVALLALPLEPGARAIAQLRLESPIVARTGDHAVIRSYSPVHTIAGGIVLEPSAPKRKRLDPGTAAALRRLGADDAAVSAAVQLAGSAGIHLSRLPVLTGLTPAMAGAALDADAGLLLAGERVLPAAPLHACCDAAIDYLAVCHAHAPLADGPEREAVRKALGPAFSPLFDVAISRLLDDGRVVAAGSCLALHDHRPSPDSGQQTVLVQLLALYDDAGLQPPDLQELPADLAAREDLPLLLRHLERDGRLTRLTNTRWCDTAAVAGCIASLRSALPTGAPYPVARYRDELGLTRKHLIPLLEFLDRAGVTRRIGGGRALPAPVAAPAGRPG
ncbi:MAG: selenocysteine-specific translation elongation factor, partial [Gemmatimonadota bacterium]